MTSQNNPDRNFDLRTLEYLLDRGTITQKEYDAFLKSLPDDEGNFEAVEIPEEEPAQGGNDTEESAEAVETVSLD